METKIKTYLTDAGRIGNGFETERLDCAVRAYSIVFSMPYYEAHTLFEQLGRKAGHRVKPKIIKALCPIGVDLWLTKSQTVSKFIKEHPKGRFYCYNRSHAFAIIDGVIFDDAKHTGKTRIYWYCENKVLTYQVTGAI